MTRKAFFSIIRIPKTRSILCYSTSSSTSTPSNLRHCVASLQQCALNKNIRLGQLIHSQLLATGLFSSSPLCTTSLINMYAKCDQLSQATLVFNQTPDYDRNVFVYNAMISGFVSNGLAEGGLEVYRDMRSKGVMPDKYTFPCIIKGLCEIMAVSEVKKTHSLSLKLGLELDMYVGSALVSSYLKFEFLDEAHEVFDEIAERDVALWNSMLNGYAQTRRFSEALWIFGEMIKQGILINNFTVSGILSVFAVMENVENGRVIHGIVLKLGYDSAISVCNALIDMYGKCKRVSDARAIFETMKERDIFSWNSIISANGQCADYDGALRLFGRMLSNGVPPDLVTVTTILPACSHMAALMLGRNIHGYVIVNALGNDGNSENDCNVQMNNAFLDMYTKCGSMRDAQLFFYNMNNKDIASWNIMIMGYGTHGNGNEALDMFSSLCEVGLCPNEITFVGVLLACSHAGFVSRGREFLEEMESKYRVIPTIEHYACIIDMLGRAGELEEAYKLALTMPMEANPVIWRALLAACRLHANEHLAEVAAQRVLELDPSHCGNYVLMSNVYVAAGRYEEVLDVRLRMKQQNVKKTPGCSWIELKNGMNTFITGDQMHPEAESIYSGLHLLTAQLREHGYVPHL